MLITYIIITQHHSTRHASFLHYVSSDSYSVRKMSNNLRTDSKVKLDNVKQSLLLFKAMPRILRSYGIQWAHKNSLKFLKPKTLKLSHFYIH